MTIGENIIINLVCGLSGLLAGNRLSLGRDRILSRENEIRADKRELLPALNIFIERCLRHPTPVMIHDECVRKIEGLYLKFRILLKHRHLAKADRAWENLAATNQKELCGNSNTGVFDIKDAQQAKELSEIQQMLKNKLSNFYDAIEKS